MPELPEVERWRALAERHLQGRAIHAVKAFPDPIVFSGVSSRAFACALRGRTVTAVRRRGKHLWMELERRPWPAFHFGMTGSFRVYEDPADRPRFLKCEFLTADGVRLGYSNARRLGRIRLLEDPATEPPISALGFDPLLDLPARGVMRDLLGRRKAPIKALLLDQGVFAGVGNWIADEVLYQARIHPAKPAHRLSPGEVDRLRARLRGIVAKAVAVNADSSRFPRTWLFHHRWGRDLNARTARGERLAFATIGGRTTAFAPRVQRYRKR